MKLSLQNVLSSTAAMLLTLSLMSVHGHPALGQDDASKAGEGWIDIVGSEGPTGIAKVGDKVAQCSDVRLDPNSKKLIPQPGVGVVAALDKRASNLHSKKSFGDCELQLEFMIGKGSNSGVKLQGRYEIQLFDSFGKAKPTARECGGIYPHWKFGGKGKGLDYIDLGTPPRVNAAKPAGEWQTLRIVFTAPRFNEAGEKIKNARFKSVVLNGQTIHDDVELDSPTGNASTPLPETRLAPIMLQLDHGAVAFRNVRIRPLDENESQATK